MNTNKNHGFSQRQLREIYVDDGTPFIQMPDGGPLLVIKCKGEGPWIGDHTVFYTEVVQPGPKPRTLRDKFNDFFEELTGWDPSEHPDKQYVDDLWDAFEAGAESGEA